jgi:hypothetical protein
VRDPTLEKTVSIFTESVEKVSSAVGDVVNCSSSEHAVIVQTMMLRYKKIRFI